MFNLYTLDNGLRVVTEYIEHVNSISVGIMVQNRKYRWANKCIYK